MSDGGKGSAQRPTDKQKFDEAYERIFGNQQKRSSQDTGQSERRKVRSEPLDTDGAESNG